MFAAQERLKNSADVHLLPGHWQTGITNTPFYDGEFLADSEEIVVVTFNYRFSIFGFGKDNVGLRDGRMALEWVRDNTAAFGGDSSRITFAGHSAGAFLADILAFAYPEDPIASAYILQSGTITALPATDPALRDDGFKNVLSLSGAPMPRMRWPLYMAKIYTMLQPQQKQKTSVPKSLKPVFGPTVDNKTVFTPAGYDERGVSGKFPQVPTLPGNANYEQGLYKLQLSAKDVFMNESSLALLTQRLATCPSAQAANWRTSRVPTWRYRYFGEFPSLKLYGPNATGTSKGCGAYHGSELSLMWGTSEILTLEKDTPKQKDMSDFLMHAWGAFIRDPHNGLKKLGWPTYSPTGNTLIELAKHGEKPEVYKNSTFYDFLAGPTCEEVMSFNT